MVHSPAHLWRLWPASVASIAAARLLDMQTKHSTSTGPIVAENLDPRHLRSRLGGWVRWIGCAAVWEAGRAVCGERHLEQTQAYAPTATEDDGVGRGNIHTIRDWIKLEFHDATPRLWPETFVSTPLTQQLTTQQPQLLVELPPGEYASRGP